MAAAMCGGSPLRMASVTKSLRKSCGVKDNGALLASVSPLAATARLRQALTVARDMCRCSLLKVRWNRNGIGGLHTRSSSSSALTSGTAALPPRTRWMIAVRTSPSSGETSSRRSASVLRRRDLQHGDDLAGGGQGVGDEAVVCQHPTDLYALNILELSAPMTAGALAQQTRLSTGATTRLIDRLEQRGHVRRIPDPTDRRRVTIEVLPNPAGASDELFGPARRRLAEVFSRFDANQLKVLFEYFEKATTAYLQATEETRR